MSNLEQSVTGIEAQACSRCVELATELVAVKHELYETFKRETELRRLLAEIQGDE